MDSLRYWVRRCESERPNTLCFGRVLYHSDYEIALEDLSNSDQWEEFKLNMSVKRWFTPAMLQWSLNAANAFHGCDIRERSKRFVANDN